MKTKLEKAFDNYIKEYDLNNKKIKFKYYHSYRVKELMRELATKLKLSKEEIELSEVIGLLHDIGRFEQIRSHGDCSDVKTGIDHADESCIYLFDKGHIKDYYDNEKNYQIVKDAIKNHNKYIIDNKLTGKNLLFTNMIRDVDKIDIFQVLYEEYLYKYNKDDVSKEVIEAFNKKATIDSHLRKTQSDTIYTYFAFIYGINYIESFEILKKTNNFEKLCSVIIPDEKSIEDYNKLKQKMNKYIEEKIKEKNIL